MNILYFTYIFLIADNIMSVPSAQFQMIHLSWKTCLETGYGLQEFIYILGDNKGARSASALISGSAIWNKGNLVTERGTSENITWRAVRS